MKVKVLNPQTVEWKEFNDLRSDTAVFNSDIQGRFYKGMEYLSLAKQKFDAAANHSATYRMRLTKLSGGPLGEAQVYDEKVWAKIYAIRQALEGIETLAKDIDPLWTMSLQNYNFKKKGGEDGSE